MNTSLKEGLRALATRPDVFPGFWVAWAIMAALLLGVFCALVYESVERGQAMRTSWRMAATGATPQKGSADEGRSKAAPASLHAAAKGSQVLASR